MSRLTQIRSWPVKGAASVQFEQALVTSGGVLGDRRFAVAFSDKDTVSGATMRTLSRAQLPGLVELKLEFIDTAFVLRHPSASDFEVSLAASAGSELVAACYRHAYFAADLGQGVSRWLTGIFGEQEDSPLRFLQYTRYHSSRDKGGPGGKQYLGLSSPTGFIDRYPFTIVSEASLAKLNEELVANEQAPVTMDHFGPTFVIDGLEAFEEHSLSAVHIGDIELRLHEPVDRCPYVSVDPQEAERDRKGQVLRVLRKMDVIGLGKAIFSHCASAVPQETWSQLSRVHVGQEVELIR